MSTLDRMPGQEWLVSVRTPRASAPWSTPPRRRGSRVTTRIDAAIPLAGLADRLAQALAHAEASR